MYSNKNDDNEKLYQINQAKIAIANGSWIGRGPGNSLQRNFLPHSYSDFIYAIIITFVHHFYLVLLEWLQFGSFTYFIGKVISTTLMSTLLIFVVELVMNRRKLKR
jgi:cell division protein FtsW (lipid II flippase)